MLNIEVLAKLEYSQRIELVCNLITLSPKSEIDYDIFQCHLH